MELEALANDIEDVSDPSSIEKVLICYEEIQLEAERYMEVLVEKLQDRDITWEQPWYQGNSPLTKVYKPFVERNEIEEDKFRTDKITKEEHDQIRKNWKRFIKKYDVPDKLKLFVSWKNYKRSNQSPQERTRRFITAYLARGLERTIQQVYTYIQFYKLSEIETKVYNDYEEKIMEVCFMHKLDKAPPILSVVLGRHVRGLYKRMTAVKTGKPDKRRRKWSMERAQKFLKVMLEHSKLPLEELKYRKFKKSFWLQLQEEMDCDYIYLHWFWDSFFHVQLFVQCDIKLYKLRRKLFKLLRDSSYQVWSDIRWPELVQYFPDGVTHRFLYKMGVPVVRQHPRYLKTPLSELTNFALQKIKSNRYTNKRLKRLTVNDDGSLEVIRHNSDDQNY